jgi:hypothetical protein
MAGEEESALHCHSCEDRRKGSTDGQSVGAQLAALPWVVRERNAGFVLPEETRDFHPRRWEGGYEVQSKARCWSAAGPACGPHRM